ncbi:MAG TPA: DUF4013 domain-containing protein [Methanothermobacter sp.]|nr:DUF4013 domain-containing protein [Methanothermobacter sp.]HOL68976.1 DUF4013 domain-containing protein [Methanothermobacter sp.]HPQ04885.1 DUF4013 domain-containing protein [Methanothermobacter sp.]HPU37193.1 DUF4013 domain-containing protein [Methanothermobacter sp.]
MNVGEIVGEALDYPGSNLKKVLTLGILIIISFLIIPIFLVYGYILRVIKATVAGFDELPDFDEWGDMLIDGLKVFVVAIVYMIIPVIILIASYFLAMSNPIVALIGIVIGGILAIIFGLLLAIAIAHMAFNDSLGAAFSIGEILNVISEISWLKYIIWIIGVTIINTGAYSVTMGVLNIILLPIAGLFGIAAITQMTPEIASAGFILVLIIMLLVFGLFVVPYLLIFCARALGRLYSDR